MGLRGFANGVDMEKKSTKSAAVKLPAPPPGKKIAVPTAEECGTKIRKALKAQASYSEGLEFAITVAAGNYHSYLKCLASMSKRAKVMYPVLTREGSRAYKIYPDIEHLPTISKALKESLKSLGLTLDTIEVTDDDPLEALNGKVSEALNG